VITPLLTAFVVLSFAPQGVHPEPEPAPTTARQHLQPPPARTDPDAELLRDLELLQKLDLLDHLDLFEEGR
jgi:hypothetical protein